MQHLPCRNLPAFASMEQAQSEQAQLQQAKLEQLKIDEAKAEQAEAGASQADKPAAKASRSCTVSMRPSASAAAAITKRRDAHGEHERRAAKREAEQHPHAGREKHNSA